MVRLSITLNDSDQRVKHLQKLLPIELVNIIFRDVYKHELLDSTHLFLRGKLSDDLMLFEVAAQYNSLIHVYPKTHLDEIFVPCTCTEFSCFGLDNFSRLLRCIKRVPDFFEKLDNYDRVLRKLYDTIERYKDHRNQNITAFRNRIENLEWVDGQERVFLIDDKYVIHGVRNGDDLEYSFYDV